MPVDAGLRPAVEDGDVLGLGELARGASSVAKSTSSAPRSPARSSSRETVKSARAARPAAARGAAAPRRPCTAPRAIGSVAAEVGGRVLPAVRAGEVDEPAGGEPGRRRSRASSSISCQPASVIGAWARSRWSSLTPPPFRLPMPSEPPPRDAARRCVASSSSPSRASSAASPCSTMSPCWNSTPCGDLAPLGRRRSRNSRSMREVLVLLADRVAHDRPRLRVALDRQPLLVPADRLGLLGQRRAQPRERPGLGRAARPAARGTGRIPYAATYPARVLSQRRSPGP